MQPNKLLADLLKAWGSQRQDSLIIACGSLLAAGREPTRAMLEHTRDRLDREQERGANSSEGDQRKLALMVAGIDALRREAKTN